MASAAPGCTSTPGRPAANRVRMAAERLDGDDIGSQRVELTAQLAGARRQVEEAASRADPELGGEVGHRDGRVPGTASFVALGRMLEGRGQDLSIDRHEPQTSWPS